MQVMKPDAFHALPLTAKLGILPTDVAIQKQSEGWEVAHPNLRQISAHGKTLNNALTTWWALYCNRQDMFQGVKPSTARLV